MFEGARKLELYEISAKEYSMFVIACENLAEAHDTRSWLEGLDGVKQVRMGILKEQIPVRMWLDMEIAKRLNDEQGQVSRGLLAET